MSHHIFDAARAPRRRLKSFTAIRKQQLEEEEAIVDEDGDMEAVGEELAVSVELGGHL